MCWRSLFNRWVVIVTDNQAVIVATTDNSAHSGFMLSLHICKALDHWFKQSLTNVLELRWFPRHKGLVINEEADALAASSFPAVRPRSVPSTASCKRRFRTDALLDWQSQSLPLIQQCQLCLKGRCQPLLPQLWDKPNKHFISLLTTTLPY